MKKLVGLFASVALMTSGAALAFDSQQDQTTDTTIQSGQGGSGTQQGSTGASESQPGMGSTGGSGSQGSQQGSQVGMGSQMGGSQQAMGNEVTGEVIKSDRKSVYLKSQDGAVVQLKVDKKTTFGDPAMKSARDLKQGTEIRANFNVEGTNNIATSIQPSQGGMGGSGDVLSPDTGINQDSPMQDDTGGSGSMEQPGGLEQPGSMDQPGHVDPGSDSDIGGAGDTSGEKKY